MLTLNVCSSSQAIGVTAAVASGLMEHNIRTNVVAARYHDHIFVADQDVYTAYQAIKDQ